MNNEYAWDEDKNLCIKPKLLDRPDKKSKRAREEDEPTDKMWPEYALEICV